MKILRSDDAKDYFSFELFAILSSHGILHPSTCPHTLQNGRKRKKKKNTHLVEIAHNLLLGASIPTHQYGDVILTTCFLINRMPSSSLEKNHTWDLVPLQPRQKTVGYRWVYGIKVGPHG